MTPPGTETQEPMEACVVLIHGSLSQCQKGDGHRLRDQALLATGKGGGAPHNPSRQPCTPALLGDSFLPSHITQSTISVDTANGMSVRPGALPPLASEPEG